VHFLEKCLAALYTQDVDTLVEIIVVDNDTPEFTIEDWENRHPKVSWYRNTKKRNPYTSRNIGISKARGRFLAFIDVKCAPEPVWLRKMISAFDSDHLIIAGHYKLDYKSDAIQDKVYGMLYLNTEKNVRKRYGVTAGNLLVERSVFDKIGDFQDSVISGNDIVWSLKALNSGIKIRYEPEAIIIYPAQTWAELKVSVQKYASGVAHISPSPRPGLAAFLPLRYSTFVAHLHHRSLENLSIWRKLQLWLYTWVMKAKYSLALYKSVNKTKSLSLNDSK